MIGARAGTPWSARAFVMFVSSVREAGIGSQPFQARPPPPSSAPRHLRARGQPFGSFPAHPSPNAHANMALWTPYAEDAALDLSKSAVQESRFSNYSPELSYPPQLSAPQDYLPYNGFYMPVGQTSPGGSSSGYDSVSFSPMAPRHVTLSPPASPTEITSKRPYHMVDVDSLSDDPDFQEFERNALRVMAEKNGGALLGNNPRMRRSVRSTNSDAADDAYRRQRERNNYAAKQSRDRRKLREIHLALKVSYLRKEVAALKAALSTRVCGRCQQTCLC